LAKRIFSAIIIMFLLTTTNLFASDFSYKFGGAAIVFDKADNLWARGDSKVDSLSSKAGSKAWFLPVPLLEVIYKEPTSGAQASLGTSFDDAGAIGLGFSIPTNAGKLRSSLFYSFIATAWENPYLTGVSRESTSASEFGGSLALDEIIKSGASLGYKITRLDVKNDLSGDIYPELKRSGFGHRFTASWKFPAYDGLLITKPEFCYERRDMDGAANSFNGYEPGIGITVNNAPVLITAKLSGIFHRYDGAMPIPEFANATRDETGYGTSLILIFPKLLGKEKWESMLGVMRREMFSNLEFFNNSSTIGFASLNYRF
jgi:hypothetical protein